MSWLGEPWRPPRHRSALAAVEPSAEVYLKAACFALVRLGADDDRAAAALEKLAQESPGGAESRIVALMRESFDRSRGSGGASPDAAANSEEARREALDQAMADLESADVETRGRAISRLRGLGGADAVATLVSALKDPVERIRAGAVRVLAELRALEATPTIAHCLRDDPSAYVRRVCASRYGSIADERLTAALIGALGDPDWEVQRAASAALGNKDDRTAIAPLLPLLNHPEREVRFSVSWALLKLKAADHRLVSALENLSKDPEAEEYDLEADEWNCDLEKQRQMAREEGWPEPGPQLKMRELVEQARSLLARSES